MIRRGPGSRSPSTRPRRNRRPARTLDDPHRRTRAHNTTGDDEDGEDSAHARLSRSRSTTATGTVSGAPARADRPRTIRQTAVPRIRPPPAGSTAWRAGWRRLVPTTPSRRRFREFRPAPTALTRPFAPRAPHSHRHTPPTTVELMSDQVCSHPTPFWPRRPRCESYRGVLSITRRATRTGESRFRRVQLVPRRTTTGHAAWVSTRCDRRRAPFDPFRPRAPAPELRRSACSHYWWLPSMTAVDLATPSPSSTRPALASAGRGQAGCPGSCPRSPVGPGDGGPSKRMRSPAAALPAAVRLRRHPSAPPAARWWNRRPRPPRSVGCAACPWCCS